MAKIFTTIKAGEMTAISQSLAAATLQQTAAFIPAGQMLSRIMQASNGLRKDILGATLRIVAGQPCSEVLPVLSKLRDDMKLAKAAGDSSVGTVRAAVAALAARHGPSHPVPTWKTAAEARAAKAAAEAPVDGAQGGTDGADGAQDGTDGEPPKADPAEVIARQAAELEELRAIAAEARRALKLAETATLAEVLAELRTIETTAE